MRYTASDLRRSQEDRDNWSLFYQQPPSLPAPVARWRHWKPRQLQETDPITQRQLEKELRLKWAQRLISLLALENLQAQGFTQVPWTEVDVRDHLNRMRAEEASPHKIQRVWETLRWFSKRFGFLKIDACERLMEKKKTLQEEGVDTVARPQRKAILPTKEVIWTLEEVAAGPGPAPAQSGEGPSPVELLDQYICGVVRFQVACSARFNDLQHTIPTAYKFHGGIIEFQAWQTKTVSAFRSKKSPVPLLAPTYSFTGRDWWTPLMRTWDKMKDLEKFKDLDFIIPSLSKDSTGIIPRPSAADRALRWLKAALTPPSTGWSLISGGQELPPPLGPLRVVSASKKKSSGQYTVHPHTEAVGCGWEPPTTKALDLSPQDFINDLDSYAQCNRCFKKYTFPREWHDEIVQAQGTISNESLSSLSSGSDTLDSVDTDSDNEKTSGQALIGKGGPLPVL